MHVQGYVDDLREQVLTRPDSFAMFDKSRPWFEPGGWGFSPIGQHRDSDTLTRSNWQVITADLLARFPESFEVIGCRHWAVGWFDHLAVNTLDAAAMVALAEWLCALEDYPVANESHWSELELTEASEYWAQCSVRDRLALIEHSGAHVSRFAARRDYLPADDCDRLVEYITTP